MTEELKQQLKQLIIDSLELEEMTPEDIEDDLPLFSPDGLGLDSVDALELGLALQKQYGFDFSNDSTELRQHFQSINTLAAFIQTQQ